MNLNEYHIAHNWQQYEDFRIQKKTGLTTGFKEIDKKIWFLPGITTLVGTTGLGKSYFSMNVYLNLAKLGVPVILIDKEIGFVNIRTRLLCSLGGLEEKAITSGRFFGNEAGTYAQSVTSLSKLPIYYFSDLQQEDLEEYIKEVGKLHNRRVFVVIDSLNRLIRDYKDRRGDVDSWGTLINNLKLKYDNFVNFWLICEENKEDRIKESGTIEHLTELWLRMYRGKDGEIILDCKKQRSGPQGIIATLANKKPFCYQMETVEYLPE